MGDRELNKIIAKNIAHYMEKNGKTRQDVCRDLGYPYTTLMGWLYAQNCPKIERIEEMARYFGCTPSDLIADQNYGHGERYYIDESARELAEFLYNNPEYKVLFDASRHVRPEDIDFVREMLDRMKGTD